jgi:hypothetical protein
VPREACTGRSTEKRSIGAETLEVGGFGVGAGVVFCAVFAVEQQAQNRQGGRAAEGMG